MNEMAIEQKVWVNAWCSVARANDCKSHETAASWADNCLRAFRAKFGDSVYKLEKLEADLKSAKEDNRRLMKEKLEISAKLRDMEDSKDLFYQKFQEAASDYNKKTKELATYREVNEEMFTAIATSKDSAYEERDKLVAALSKIFPAWLGLHNNGDEDPGWDPEWLRTVLIQLPTGQVSWHIKESELPMFAHLKQDLTKPWDGHDTPEKYRRLAALPAWPLVIVKSDDEIGLKTERADRMGGKGES